ncbi:hypothetical protein I8U18_05490 [Thermoactinomyces sp. CICC 10522]|nr:hypothetical protein [Thermoactinomyces sp. CICC 10522]
MESIMTAETGKKKPKQETEERESIDRQPERFTHRFAHVTHSEEIQPDDFDRFNQFTQSFNQSFAQPVEKADETDEFAQPFAHFDQPITQPDEFDQPNETDSTDRINQPAGGMDDVAGEADDVADETGDQPTAHVTQEANQSDESTTQPDEITQLADQPTNQPDESTAQLDEQTDEVDEIAQQDEEVGEQVDEMGDETVEPEPKTPREWAMMEYEKNGDLPSRRGLARLAGCSEYKAGNVLKELRAELGLAS